jgi:hypothetical protein
MTRGQITFVAFLLLAFTVLGRWTFAESKARDARIRAVTADKAAAVYLHLYEARGDSIALLASDLAIADSVYRADRDSWQLDRERYVEQAVNEQADHAALADRIRAQVSDVVAVQVDSMEAAGVAAVGAERSARVNAEAEVVRVVEIYDAAAALVAQQTVQISLARRTIAELAAGIAARDVLIDYFEHPNIVKRIADAVPSVGKVALVVVVVVVLSARTRSL